MNPKLRSLQNQIEKFTPACEQEERDQDSMLRFLKNNDDCLERTNLTGHFTASSWIINESGDKVLMVYHKIYNSWSWTGGHADGQWDLSAVAIREAMEESGIRQIELADREPVSLEILTVDGHEKRGVYVPSHLHMNLTYLLRADENQRLYVKEDENSGVRWIDAALIQNCVSEPWMMQRIYTKLLRLHRY